MNQLSTPLNFKEAASIPIHFYGAADRVEIDSVPLRAVEQTIKVSVLEDGNGVRHTYTHEQLYLLKSQDRLRVTRGYYDPDSKKLSAKYGSIQFADFPEHKVKKALFYTELVKEYLRFEAIGIKHPALEKEGFTQKKISRGDACLKVLLPILKRSVADRWAATNGGEETSYKLVGPRQFRRMFDALAESNFDPIALISKKAGPGRRANFHRDDVELWWEFARLYANEERPSMRTCQLLLVGEIIKRNNALKPGQRRFNAPSRKTFEGMIKSMGVYYLTAKRFTEEYARNKFAIVHNGAVLDRPGQKIEMDEWLVDLSVLATKLNIWELLTEEERQAIDRVRVWLTVAIDCATKCILAMSFSHRRPSHRSSLAALELVVTDKTLISEHFGTKDPWNYALVPEKLYTDFGAAFADHRFRAAAATLRIDHIFPPTGSPAARGTIESFFHTCGMRYLDYFKGRTFSNIIQKGKRDAQGRACLNLDEFNQLFVQATVDVYHNTPHSGLGFETPKNAWRRLGAHCAIMEPLGSRDRRRIFGTELTRTIGDKGVVVNGVHYNCTKLQRSRFEHTAVPGSPAPKIAIRYGRLDISEISFLYNGEWVEAQSTIKLPKHTTVYEWVGAKKELMEIHGENAKPGLSTMLEAMSKLRESGAAAAARAGLGADILQAGDYDAIERRYFKKPIADDLEGRARELVAMAKARNPLEVGIEAFDEFVVQPDEDEDEVAAKTKAEPVVTSVETNDASAFTSSFAADGDDDIVFEDDN